MSKNNNDKQKQSKITSFISITQTSKKSNLLHNKDDLFSANFELDNYESNTTVSECSYNEQDTNNIELKNPKYNCFAKENLKWNPNWKKTYPWVDLVIQENSKYMVCTWYIDTKYNNIFVTGTQYFKKQYLQRHMERSDHKKLYLH
ncbi:1194_t:CDS:1 [Dentiscutata erythropus]|uniref:1194_t:CDS:1 n=1 Tax=Dentiscutata erythropus TaxID=1348616 RepID=A0A9N9G8J5_9GLOM|nr:1194_t:CDS:1 [Dentiscutata erythropus]